MKAFELQTPAGVTLATLITVGGHDFGEVVGGNFSPPFAFRLTNTGDETITNIRAWIELTSQGGRIPRVILGGTLITATTQATAQLIINALPPANSMNGTSEYQSPLTANDSGRLRLQGT